MQLENDLLEDRISKIRSNPQIVLNTIEAMQAFSWIGVKCPLYDLKS